LGGDGVFSDRKKKYFLGLEAEGRHVIITD
jgi:hypothetical protein